MKIITLMENNCVSEEFKHMHGLSFYVETVAHKILFDLGANEYFYENALALGVDISAVDTVVISHGHNDHGGALGIFLEHNHSAKVYIHKNAFGEFCSQTANGVVNIGLDSGLKNHAQVVLVDDFLQIDEELQLFSGVRERELYSSANNTLMCKCGNELVLDDFSHEQNLLIFEDVKSEGSKFEGCKSVLFAGCAHNGVVNIQRRAEKLANGQLDVLISGFHLHNPRLDKYESDDVILGIGEFFKGHKTAYYTCHCTGKLAFLKLQDMLGEQIGYLATGAVLEV